MLDGNSERCARLKVKLAFYEKKIRFVTWAPISELPSNISIKVWDANKLLKRQKKIFWLLYKISLIIIKEIVFSRKISKAKLIQKEQFSTTQLK